MRIFDDANFFDSSATNETVASDPLSMEHIYFGSIQAQWTGSTIAGTIKLQANNTLTEANWEDVADSSVTISAASSYLWNLTTVGYKYIRVSLTSDDANTITVTTQVYGKGY